MIYDLCDCNLLLHCQNSLCFLGLVAAEVGEVGASSLCTQSTFGYLSVGQLIASVFAELVARVPRKMLGFEEIVINFAKRKKSLTSLTPNPSPSGEGSD